MARILLLFARSANSEFVSEKLAQHHEVLSLASTPHLSAQTLLQVPFDLCIVDGPTLEQLWQPIQACRSAQEPVLLPMVLVVAREKVGMIKRQLWQVIEEIVTAPIETAELQARVEVLLRARQYSLELHQANIKLQQANDDLQEMNRLKSQFVSMVSHEFRNPLGAISGYIQLLEGQGNHLAHEKKQEFFQHIRDSLKRLIALVDDVLVMGRVGVGKLTFEPAPLDLQQFCQRLLEEVKYSIPQPCEIQYSTVGSLTADSRIVMDQKLLRYILANLLTNAIKYSPEGCPVQFEVNYDPNQVRFRIQDQGIGIPPEDQQRLFEPFYRATNVGQLPGTGLGLVIAKQCADLHGGHIWVDSVLDQGTTVTVQLPLHPQKIDPENLSPPISPTV